MRRVTRFSAPPDIESQGTPHGDAIPTASTSMRKEPAVAPPSPRRFQWHAMSPLEPKPAHLGPRYAAMFLEPDVARSYAARPPYPAELIDVLGGLSESDCPCVLDAGAGTGDIARPLARRLLRVDAVDPSLAMIDEGRRSEGGDAPNLRWILGGAETAPLEPPYGLVVAGQSLAWME